MSQLDLRDTECIFCKAKNWEVRSQISDEEIVSNAVTCASCQKSFPSIFGLPYLGSFGVSDIISLIEISSFSERFTKQGKDGKLELTNYKGLNYLTWIQAIEEYTTANNPAGVLKRHLNIDDEPSWLPNRLREHLSFCTVLDKIDLKNKTVLDIGAGSGFDSLKYYNRGAQVTALEYNPILAAVGRINFPQIRWFGGSSYTLPFQDNSFDYITANAALHHLLDIPRSMEEMIRVLKPGGKIITISDSFSPEYTSEYNEAKIFNDHPDVLLGLNEQAPSFDKFVKVLKENREYLDTKFYTHSVSGLSNYSRSWNFDEALELLPKTSGYFASIVITKKDNFRLTPKVPEVEVISPFEYSATLTNQANAMTKLADKIPSHLVDLNILCDKYPKFRLMNGWKLLNDNSDFRAFFKRGRLFFSNKKIAGRKVQVKICSDFQENFQPTTLNIFLDNEQIFSKAIIPGLEEMILFEIPPSKTNRINSVLEFRYQTTNQEHAANVLKIGELDWNPSVQDVAPKLSACYGLETLLFTHFADQKEIRILTSTDFKHSLSIINRIRKFNKTIEMFLSNGQEDFFSWIPNLTIINSYPDYNVHPTLFDTHDSTSKETIDLIIASDEISLDKLTKKYSGSFSERTYVVTKGGLSSAVIPFSKNSSL